MSNPIFTTTEDVSDLLPPDYGDLVVRPTQDESIAFQVSDVVVTANHTFHIPIVADDGDAGWYAEGEDMSGDGPEFAGLTITPAKVGRVVDISNELADDSTPEAGSIVGQALGRAVAVKIDAAYFGDLASPAPAGLESLDATVSEVDAGGSWIDTDPFAEAIAVSETFGGKLRYFVANPTDFLALMRIKKTTDSNEPLFGNDATAATKRAILGAELKSSPAVEVGTVWGIDPRFSKLILRRDVTVERSRHAKFANDLTQVKVTMRVGFGFPHPEALVRILLDGGS